MLFSWPRNNFTSSRYENPNISLAPLLKYTSLKRSVARHLERTVPSSPINHFKAKKKKYEKKNVENISLQKEKFQVPHTQSLSFFRKKGDFFDYASSFPFVIRRNNETMSLGENARRGKNQNWSIILKIDLKLKLNILKNYINEYNNFW